MEEPFATPKIVQIWVLGGILVCFKFKLTLLALESEVNEVVAIVFSDEKRGRTTIRHETKPKVCKVKSWKHEMENG